MHWTASDIVMNSLRALLVLAFVALGWREIGLLFRRPAPNMGMGWSRVWAIARTTMFEAWAGRIWMLPILWLIVSFLLIMVVRPFDPSERIPLNIRMLLGGQELLLMLMIWVMACVSLPRERERKTAITTASKPLSRLEYVLGKMVGFSVMSGAMLLVMGVLSMAILWMANAKLMRESAAAFEVQKTEFHKAQDVARVDKSKNPKATVPSAGLEKLSQEGSLKAHNFITVSPENFSLGAIDLARDPANPDAPPRRFLMGGTAEKAMYKFWPNLPIHRQFLIAPPGARPYFQFFFPHVKAPNVDRVRIRVTVYRSNPHATPPPRPQEKVLTLTADGFAGWELDEPDEVFTTVDNDLKIDSERGEVTVSVECITPGSLLHVLEGAAADPETGMVPESARFNVEFVPNRFASARPMAPLPRPVVRGIERRGRQEIFAPKPSDMSAEVALYRFVAKDLENVPVNSKGEFTLSLLLENYKGDNSEIPTRFALRVFALEHRDEPSFEVVNQEVLEKRVVHVQVPAKHLGDPKNKRREMLVLLYCETPEHSISLIENSVRIELPATPFVVNLLKSELVMFMESVLLIGICVACSIRVGWPVAMLCSGLCYLFGIFVNFIVSLQDYGGLGALNYNAYAAKAGAFEFFDTLTMNVWKVLGVIATFVPNFTIYESREHISALQNLPWSVVLGNCMNTGVYMVPIIGIAYLLFRKQELG